MQTFIQRIKMSASTRIKAVVAGLGILLLSMVWASAFATISSVTVAPVSVNAPLGGSASVTITWSVTVTGTTPTITVNSPNGTFGVGNIILGTNPTSLSRTITLPTAVAGPSTATALITEVVLIPRGVIQEVYAGGVASFVYNRNFTDPSSTLSNQVTVNITSSALSGFSISGMSLSFDDDSVVRVVQPKQKFSAKAVIDYNGTGLLRGVWEVADPASTASKPIYRPLLQVHQYLTGFGKQTLTSPELPAGMMGLYLLRLRVTDPIPGFAPPILRYVVSSGKPGQAVPVLPIGLVLPASKTLLVPDTLFAWKSLPGTRVYQIEFYPHAMTEVDKLPDLGDSNTQAVPQTLPKTPPVAGIQVSGKQTKTVLSGSTFSHLKSGKIYLWRVVAIDGKGNLIGASEIREIRLP